MGLLIKLQCIVQLALSMHKFVQKSIGISKTFSFVFSLVWLLLVIRYLDLRPDYAHRNYLRTFQQVPKNNNGVVHMSKISSLSGDKVMSGNPNEEQESLKYFNFLYVSQNNKMNCKSHLQVLFINANFKQTGDSYLSVYKQIEKHNPKCKHSIYQLSRKDHLLMNSELLITDYANQVAKAIQYLTNHTQITKLLIVSFQQSCVITIKSLQLLSTQTIQKLNGFVFINAYNQNLRIVYQTPFRFIKTVQDNLLYDKSKMKMLNLTRLIFINTLSFFDNVITYKQSEEQHFNFVFGNRKLKNTLFITTRFMRNLNALLHEKDYFGYSYFSTIFAKFLVQDSYKTMTIKYIQYYFYYGEVYANANYQLVGQNCFVRNPPNIKNGLIKQRNQCVLFNFACNCRNRNQPFAVKVTSKAYLYNDRLQKLDPFYQFKNMSYYLIQQTTTTKKIAVINPQKQQIAYTSPPVYSPISNPLPVTFLLFFAYSIGHPQRQIEQKLIRVCPHGNIISFPQHFFHYYIGESQIHAIYIYVLKFVIDYYQLTNDNTFDCYPDFTTQLNIIPKQISLQWQFSRNSLFFLLLSSHFRNDGLYARFYYYLIFYFFIVWYYLHQRLHSFVYFILCAAICIQKVIKIIVHLTGFVQQILDLKYRKFMLAITLTLAILKAIGSNIQQFAHLSAWKVLCISLIFVVNKYNLLILLIKMYFLYDHIIYNHSDLLEIILVLIWIYVGLNKQQKQGAKQKQILKQNNLYSMMPSLFLLAGFILFMDGPSFMINYTLNLYIGAELIQICLNKFNLGR